MIQEWTSLTEIFSGESGTHWRSAADPPLWRMHSAAQVRGNITVIDTVLTLPQDGTALQGIHAAWL